VAELVRITDYIKNEAIKEAKEMVDLETRKCRQDFLEKQQKALEEFSEIIDKAKQDTFKIRSLAESAARQKGVQHILQAKNEMIKQTVDLSIKMIHDMRESEYEKILSNLLLKRCNGFENAQIQLGKEDNLKKLDGFKKHVKKLGMTIQKQSAAFDNGFVIKKGKIEENCSIDAIFSENKDRIVDFVNQQLFGGMEFE